MVTEATLNAVFQILSPSWVTTEMRSWKNQNYDLSIYLSFKNRWDSSSSYTEWHSANICEGVVFIYTWWRSIAENREYLFHIKDFYCTWNYYTIFVYIRCRRELALSCVIYVGLFHQKPEVVENRDWYPSRQKNGNFHSIHSAKHIHEKLS